MTPDEAVVAVVEAFDAVELHYMIVGSLASNVHGVPRSTRDADFVIDLVPGRLEKLARALPRELTLQPQGAFETVTGTTRYVIELTESPFVCELFVCSEDAHDLERLRRRETVEVFGRLAFVASAEDMVITKLRWADQARRTKDRDDIRNILAVRTMELDWAYIQRWADEHGTSALLDDIRRSVPPQ